MSRILVTPRSLTRGNDPELDRLREAGHEVVLCTPGRTPVEAELVSLVPGCVGWLAGVERIGGRVIAAADALRVICRNGTGVDSIDLEACRGRGIAVLRAEGANARGVAELVLGLVLAHLRSLPFHDATLHAGGWERRQGIELEGRTLGVIGTGRIGARVARFGLALDMRVIAHDLTPNPALAALSGFRYAPVPDLLAASDIVTLHCPHTPGSPPLIDAAALANVRRGCLLVNTARWGLVDAGAVLAALEEGRLGGYAVDAYETEPPPPLPLLRHARVIATPHIGAYTTESVARSTRQAVDNLLEQLCVR